MKFLAALPLGLLPTLAHAHDIGAHHTHPHTDWTALIALGAVVAGGALVLLMRRASAISNKDKNHDPR